MLVQFSVKNYKSIKDKVTLDLQATSIKEHKDSLLSYKDEDSLLPLTAIYGPNGGGKSNIISALNCLVEIVRKHNYESDFNIPPYIFQDGKTATEFELYFRTPLCEFCYTLHILDNKIVYEKLSKMKFDTNRVSELFERSGDNIKLKNELAKLNRPVDIEAKLPLLSYLRGAYKTNETVSSIISWFSNRFIYLGSFCSDEKINVSFFDIDSNLEIFKAILKELDLDIYDLVLDKDHKSIFTVHIVNNVQRIIDLSEESCGIRKLFYILPYVIDSLVSGKILVIDDLEQYLHYEVIKYILSLYSNPKINKHNAQLIFTSNDLYTMNNLILRRDEIWFADKGNEENTELYSLIEFRDENGVAIRNDAKYDKQYLEGKYGALPYITHCIDWDKFISK